MTIYLVLIATVITFGFLCKVSVRFGSTVYSGETIYLISLIIFFVAIMGMRGLTVGTDTAAYARDYIRIGSYKSFIESISNISNTAPSFVLLCRLCYFISDNPQIYTFVTAVVIHCLLFRLIKLTSESYCMSAFLYLGLTLFYYAMNGNRQTIAMLLFLNALINLTDNIKDYKAWLLIAFAAGMHVTSLILLIAVGGILLSERITDKKIVIAISIIAGACFSFLLDEASMLIARFFPHYAIYLSGKAIFQILESTSDGRIIVVYLFLAVFIILDLMRKELSITDKDHIFNKLLPMMVFGVVFGILNYKNSLVNRLMWYFIAIFMTYIPFVVKKYNKSIRIILIIGIYAGLILYNLIFLKENQSGVVPYEFFWK